MFVTAIIVYTVLYLAKISNFKFQIENLSDILPYLLSLFIMIIALILLIIHLTTDFKPVILPLIFGWQIFLEVLKDVKTLFLGIGPTNFITAFTLTKPIALNQTPFWNIVFTSSSSLLLTLATETGILAALFYLIIFLKSLRSNNHELRTMNYEPLHLTLLFLLLLQILLPSSMAIFILTIILLALSAEIKIIREISLAKIGYLNYLFPALVALFAVIILYFCGRAYLAEVFFKQSLDAVLNNQSQKAYDRERLAITLNPFIDRYHRAFSQVNLAIAANLSAKQEISEEDKQNIPKLVQQSIDYGRSAVNLYRTNVINWDNLAQIYTALGNFAQGSANWAKSSLEQRVQLDPFSPGGYLILGSFYLQEENYDEAEKSFRTALALKSNLANTHYQLGLLFTKMKKYEEAYRELQTTKALLIPESSDAKRIEAQIAELSKLLPKDAAIPEVQTAPAENKQTLEENPLPALSFP
jgi:tetratricopeptide (TPR) repeat protein